MNSLLTYRSRDSFESHLGRKPTGTLTPPESPRLSEADDAALAAHNDDLRNPNLVNLLLANKIKSNHQHPKHPVFSAAQSYLDIKARNSHYDSTPTPISTSLVNGMHTMLLETVSSIVSMKTSPLALTNLKVLSTLPSHALRHSSSV